MLGAERRRERCPMISLQSRTINLAACRACSRPVSLTFSSFGDVVKPLKCPAVAVTVAVTVAVSDTEPT